MFLKLRGQAAATGEGVQNCQGGGRGQYKWEGSVQIKGPEHFPLEMTALNSFASSAAMDLFNAASSGLFVKHCPADAVHCCV